jgi:hypothetical protein
MLLVGMVEDVGVVVINVVANKYIGDEFQERGLSDASLSKKQDGVSHVVRFVVGGLDDPLLERLYVTRKSVRTDQLEIVEPT